MVGDDLIHSYFLYVFILINAYLCIFESDSCGWEKKWVLENILTRLISLLLTAADEMKPKKLHVDASKAELNNSNLVILIFYYFFFISHGMHKTTSRVIVK